MRIFAILAAFPLIVGSINPPTSVLELNEKFLEVKDEGMWFVEFYAPWCAHCKRLHPVWDQVGHALADGSLPIRVGKVDCTRFQSVSNSLNIAGYPTIIFFRNGQRIDYRGSREKEALVSFAKKCAAPVVEAINENKLAKLRLDSRSEPFVVYYGNKNSDLFSSYNKIANSLFSMTRFYAIDRASGEENFRERVTVVKDNFEMEYSGKTEDELKSWIIKERWPAFVQTHSGNLADIGSSGKLIVVVVSNDVERHNNTSPVYEFHKIAENTVTELRKDGQLWDRFQFAWTDGADLASQIQMTQIEEPHLFVFNYSSYEYYLSEDEPSKMTEKSILTFLRELSQSVDKGSAIAFGGRSFLIRIQRMVFELYWTIAQMFTTQPLLSSCLFGVPIAFLSIICYSICSADFSIERDEFYPEEEEELLDEESDGHSDSDHEKAD